MRNFVYIIAEYNPPHNGHVYLISEARRMYPGAVVTAIMSGHFTERGSPAVTDKFTRARAALAIGCDLVLSLPFPFCAASAENFARGGVSVASSFARAFPGARHALVFGSECGSTELLQLTAKRVSEESFRARLYARTRGGHNAREIQSLYAELYGADAARVMDGANDALGIEYIRAIEEEGAPIEPCAVRRVGAGHDSAYGERIGGTNYASASAIRELLLRGDKDTARTLVPAAALDVIDSAKHGFSDEERIGTSVLALLRMTPPDSADSFAECGGGVGRRLISAALASGTYRELIARAATKQYTNARLRRAALYAALGIDVSELTESPHYTQLLAANDAGIKMLHDYDGALPVLTKAADSGKLSAEAQRQIALEARADRLYTLAFDPALPADTFLRTSPYIDL